MSSLDLAAIAAAQPDVLPDGTYSWINEEVVIRDETSIGPLVSILGRLDDGRTFSIMFPFQWPAAHKALERIGALRVSTTEEMIRYLVGMRLRGEVGVNPNGSQKLIYSTVSTDIIAPPAPSDVPLVNPAAIYRLAEPVAVIERPVGSTYARTILAEAARRFNLEPDLYLVPTRTGSSAVRLLADGSTQNL
jgi:hypothetical protein